VSFGRYHDRERRSIFGPIGEAEGYFFERGEWPRSVTRDRQVGATNATKPFDWPGLTMMCKPVVWAPRETDKALRLGCDRGRILLRKNGAEWIRSRRNSQYSDVCHFTQITRDTRSALYPITCRFVRRAFSGSFGAVSIADSRVREPARITSPWPVSRLRILAATRRTRTLGSFGATRERRKTPSECVDLVDSGWWLGDL
jgi:hypothetical protein